ncbi:MAG: hypothetical protein WD577_08840 [Bacteroidales bacterium]
MSAVFPLLISIYIYYEFFFNLRLIDTLPLTDVLPIFETYTFDTKKFRAGFFPRIGLPYGISPALAVSMSILIILQYFRLKELKEKRGLNIVILFSLIFLMLGTLTRTTIISLLITIFIYWITQLKVIKLKTRLKIIHLFFAFIICAIILYIPSTIFFDQLLLRLTSGKLSEDRHLLLILEGVHILFSEFKIFLFGIGDGNLFKYDGTYTFLPPHSLLNSYLTMMVHRGILGFIVTISLYINLFIVLYNKKDGPKTKSTPFLFALINIFIAFNFYELRFVTTVWIFMAISFIFLNKEDNVNISNNSSL